MSGKDAPISVAPSPVYFWERRIFPGRAFSSFLAQSAYGLDARGAKGGHDHSEKPDDD